MSDLDQPQPEFLTTRDLSRNPAKVAAHLRDAQRPVILTNKSKPIAALLPMNEFAWRMVQSYTSAMSAESRAAMDRADQDPELNNVVIDSEPVAWDSDATLEAGEDQPAAISLHDPGPTNERAQRALADMMRLEDEYLERYSASEAVHPWLAASAATIRASRLSMEAAKDLLTQMPAALERMRTAVENLHAVRTEIPSSVELRSDTGIARFAAEATRPSSRVVAVHRIDGGIAAGASDARTLTADGYPLYRLGATRPDWIPIDEIKYVVLGSVDDPDLEMEPSDPATAHKAILRFRDGERIAAYIDVGIPSDSLGIGIKIRLTERQRVISAVVAVSALSEVEFVDRWDSAHDEPYQIHIPYGSGMVIKSGLLTYEGVVHKKLLLGEKSAQVIDAVQKLQHAADLISGAMQDIEAHSTTSTDPFPSIGTTKLER